MRTLLWLLPLAAVTACAGYAAHEHAADLKMAVADDQACVEQGWKYPEPRYTSCRLKLQDDRLHQAWMNMQLMHQTQNQPTYVPPAYPYHDVYRPLDPDHFECRMTTENDKNYVLCSPDDEEKKP
jgi:hypothetical protein